MSADRDDPDHQLRDPEIFTRLENGGEQSRHLAKAGRPGDDSGLLFGRGVDGLLDKGDAAELIDRAFADLALDPGRHPLFRRAKALSHFPVWQNRQNHFS